MTIKEFFSFKQNKFFWINLIAMVIVVALVLFGVLKGLDIYTRHGEAVVVPNVKGMGVAEAEKMFRNQGLTCIVSDWVYGVKYKGRTLTNGEKVPVGATLTLIVGDGGELPQEGDSTAVEATTPTSSKDSAADESWF